MEKGQFAILRFAKYKGPEIGRIEAHNERTKEEYASNPDIDTSRSHLNFHLVKPERKYRTESERQIAAAGCRTRSDSVRVVEALITASPEFFKGKKQAEIKEFFNEALEFIQQNQSPETIISAVVHMDEKTPHKAVKIAKDKSKVKPLDINTIEIRKKVRINNEIFFDNSMYRMLSKIAFEWYCAKNDLSDHYSEFGDIVEFITTGNGVNPVSIIQEEELYKIVDHLGNLGSHILFAFEKENGEINVIISLFGLLMYRVIVAKNKPDNCVNNFLYTGLRTDSSRKEIIHQSVEEAEQKFMECLHQIIL